MKIFRTTFLMLCLFALPRADATENLFFLFHAPSETVLGPYVCQTGIRFGAAWTLTALDTNRFNVANEKGETFGPFTIAENSPVKIGDAEFLISTNAGAMLQKRAEQKSWKTAPETNPKVLAVLRGETVEGYKFRRAEPDAVTVSNPKGIDRIKLEILPEDIRQKFGFDPTNAVAYTGRQSAAVAETQRQVLQEQADKNDAFVKAWSSVEKPEVVQPDYPAPFFPTKGLDVSVSSGKGVTHSSGNTRHR